MSLPFQPKLVTTQSQDGKVLTETDSSNYGDNTDGLNPSDIVTRVITIFDQNNTLLATINMELNTPFDYDITADGFFRFHSLFTTSGGDQYTGDNKYLSTQFYKQAQLNIAPKIQCSCAANDNLIKYMSIATELYNAAMNAFITGNDINAALNIIDCNIYINKALKC